MTLHHLFPTLQSRRRRLQIRRVLQVQHRLSGPAEPPQSLSQLQTGAGGQQTALGGQLVADGPVVEGDGGLQLGVVGGGVLVRVFLVRLTGGGVILDTMRKA